MFTFIHLNFEWKHWNLRLRLYLLWIKVLGKYKMIAKMLWPLIQVNLPLMFFINEIPILSQKYKKRLYDFFTVTLRSFIKYHSPLLFSVTKHHKKRWDIPTPYAWPNYYASPSENMLQIYSRTPMPKSRISKVASQLYWNHTSARVFSCKFAVYFQNTFY